jgi:hypothetical protein
LGDVARGAPRGESEETNEGDDDPVLLHPSRIEKDYENAMFGARFKSRSSSLAPQPRLHCRALNRLDQMKSAFT